MQLSNTKIHFQALFLMLTLSTGFVGNCQQNTQDSLNDWFDNIVGKENLGINNGSVHINRYVTIRGNHNYYLTDKFIKGDVVYDNQFYKNVDLKYDTYNDILIIKSYGEYNYLGLDLIPEKTQSFIINGKTFLNLSYNTASNPKIIKGFYEADLTGGPIAFYVKHHKGNKKIIRDQAIYDEFEENNEFTINHLGVFYKITSSKDLVAIFPKLENKINDYYFMQQQTRKTNEKEFMKNLIQTLNTILLKETN